MLSAVGHEKVRLDAVAAVLAAHVEAAPQVVSKTLALRSMVLDEFLRLDIPIPEPLLSPLITRQSLSMVYAWRGIGKTWFSLGLAYAIASGGTFLRWSAPEPRRVLYLDGEMPANALQSRLATIVAGSAKEPPQADYFRLLTPDLCGNLVPDLASPRGQVIIDRVIEESQADFVVVDNLSCWVRSGGAENEAESWRTMSEWLLRHRSRGLAILLVHHAAKNGAQRGTSKREDVLDLVLALRNPPDHRPEDGAAFAVEFQKARHLSGKDAEAFEARLSVDERGSAVWATTAVKESTFERVVELGGLGLSQREIAEELGINKSGVSRHWNQAVEQGLLKRSAPRRGESR
jgi:hypothetical protein